MLIKVTIAFIAGILIAWRLEISATALVLFLIGAALTAALLRTRGRAMLPALLVAALLLGALRFELSEGRSPGHLLNFHSDQGVMIKGSIVTDPQSSVAQTRLRLHVDGIFSDGAWTTASGDVRVTLRAPLETWPRETSLTSVTAIGCACKKSCGHHQTCKNSITPLIWPSRESTALCPFPRPRC